jgi:hypothetical protein
LQYFGSIRPELTRPREKSVEQILWLPTGSKMGSRFRGIRQHGVEMFLVVSLFLNFIQGEKSAKMGTVAMTT